MKEIPIDVGVSYIAASSDPLSADMGIVRKGDDVWLYDVGNGDDPISGLEGLGPFNVVLSHFHPDHIGNIGRLDVRNLYVSNETSRHLPRDLSGRCCIHIVTGKVNIGNIRIFPLPSSHARGCLGMEVGGKHAFLGDAIYCNSGRNGRVYNAQLLKDEIAVLEDLDAPFVLCSHFPGFKLRKDEVIVELERIYAMREKESPFIPIA